MPACRLISTELTKYMMDWMNPCGGMLMMIVWLLLIILGIVALVKWMWTSESPNRDRNQDSTIEILRQRYAAGEISKEEFDKRKQNLKQ
jgi:putative membrane protein